MFQLVEEYRDSGLSANAFARKVKVAESTFGYWLRKKKSIDKESGFIEIKSDRFSIVEVELIFPNGVQLRMNGGDPALNANWCSCMFSLGSSNRYHLYRQPCDMRKSFSGLSHSFLVWLTMLLRS